MADYLVFTLAAPMASFGGVAVGERRPTGDRPTRSQIIGLIAAALGIPRTEEQRLQTLHQSLGYAVRVDDPGTLANDYHTAQRPEDASLRRRIRAHGPILTRRDELDCDARKTVLSRREFRTGVMATVLLWERERAPATLVDIKAALQAPRYALFLGRKAFPLMLPCRPEIMAAATVESALVTYDGMRNGDLTAFYETILNGRLPRRGLSPNWYADANASTAWSQSRTELRRDVPDSRAKWRFRQREEVVLAAPDQEPSS